MGGGECVWVSECMSVGVSGCGCVVVYGIWVSECMSECVGVSVCGCVVVYGIWVSECMSGWG